MEKRGLNRDVITRAAVALLDEVGLAELSTRRLAAKLGVQSPTLYWHVKNKADLLDLVAEAICADEPDPDPAAPWREQVTSGLRQFRARLLAHRDAVPVLREHPRRRDHVDTTARLLLDAGLSPDDAERGARLLSAHVLESTTDDDLFETGVEIVLDGLEHRLLT